MVTNDRPVCENANKGPSYGELLDKHYEAINNLYNKVLHIQAKIVPSFEIPPKGGDEKQENDGSLFSGLTNELRDLVEINEVLDTIVRIL